MGSYLIPSKKIIDDLFNTIQAFIRRNQLRDRKEEFYIRKKKEDIISFREEFCTFRVGLPRRAGNTTLAIKLFKKYPDSLYIASAKWALSDERFNSLSKKDSKRLLSYKSRDLIGQSASVVIVDTAHMMTHWEKQQVYSIHSDIFIFIS